ncbi:MAG: hypothetical protein ACK58T_42620 [Phycisphaerae bacterium]
MIKFFFKMRKIRIEIEKTLTNWELQDDYWSDPKKVAERLYYECQTKINQEIMKHVEMRVNSEFIDECATKAIEKFDLSEMYGIALKEKVKEIMFKDKGKP